MTQKRWPFLESPGDFATRLEAAYFAFDSDMLAAVRNCLIENPPMLASAPAPASGGVDAVLNLYREAVRVDVKMEGPQFMGANSSALKRAWEADRASLSPAATPGLAMPSREWMRDKIAADPDVEDCGAVPAATPVSEAGGDVAVFPADGELMVMENGHRSCDFERWSRGFELPLHMAESGLGRFYADDRTEWAWHSWSAALAKPASSPAEVALTAIEARADKMQPTIVLGDDESADLTPYQAGYQAGLRCAAKDIRAALSQSTSAGRVGE